MPVEVLWHPEARADLLDIYVTIGLDNPLAAERIYDLVEARARQLALHPRLGPRRPDIRPSARVLVEGPYIVLYETIPDTDDSRISQVTVVRVVDGRRDLSKLF